jgi:hypothetical protein
LLGHPEDRADSLECSMASGPSRVVAACPAASYSARLLTNMTFGPRDRVAGLYLVDNFGRKQLYVVVAQTVFIYQIGTEGL